MVLQCLAWIWANGGSLGSYVCANIVPLVFFCLFTRVTATYLGIFGALSIAESIKRLGYPLSISCFLISWSLWSTFSGSLQILIILMLNPKGMAFLVWAGRHELGNKYCFCLFLNSETNQYPCNLLKNCKLCRFFIIRSMYLSRKCWLYSDFAQFHPIKLRALHLFLPWPFAWKAKPWSWGLLC